jgi:alanyl-tRNA synthetase
VEGEVRNYYEEEIPLPETTEVIIKINKERRNLNSRYHSAAHLIGDVLLKLYGIHAVKGHQFPGEAYIETSSPLEIEKENLEKIINGVIESSLPVKTEKIEREVYNQNFDKVPYFIPEDKLFRVMGVEGYIPVPCGGTHVSNTQEIGLITIKKLSNKEGRTKISYILS